MAVLKTAISLEADLFRRTDLMARARNVSRSQFVAEALEKYIAQQEEEKILAQLNSVYEVDASAAELEGLISVYRADIPE
ncbi:MAG: CopG family transcriptional regulator [Negativicutes bacterium]